MKVYLIGMPGSGKTTLGKAVAQKLAVPFIDLDDEIIRKAGKPIKNIFAGEGEDHFRLLEKATLHEVTQANEHFLLATGGGAPCFFDNMAYMNRAGTTIFVDVPINTLMERLLASDVNERPLVGKIAQDDFQASLTTKRNNRLSYYQQAQHIVAGDDIQGDAIIQLFT